MSIGYLCLDTAVIRPRGMRGDPQNLVQYLSQLSFLVQLFVAKSRQCGDRRRFQLHVFRDKMAMLAASVAHAFGRLNCRMPRNLKRMRIETIY